MITALVVGQTPPPFHGQAVMIEHLVRARFRRVRLLHVRMAFSREIADIGRPRPGKVAHLGDVLARISAVRLRHRVDVLYFPPSGNSRAAMLRDVAVLLFARPLFPLTVFHLHAAGLADLYPRLTSAEKALFRRAYGRPDCTIRISSGAPPDGELLRTRREVVVPYGIEDAAPGHPRGRPPGALPRLLFVGMLRESKGVRVLIEACAQLHRAGRAFEVELVGDWGSNAFRSEIVALLRAEGLEERFRFRGVLTGAEKHQAYADADIFCFPTFFEAETFGVVALEAMSFGLPVVATDWRGLPSLVREGSTGYLVPPRDPSALAARLGSLLDDPERAREMGRAGRQVFLEEYTLERYLARMEQVLVEVAQEGGRIGS
jgi:glycosyltransferase involved in cell wall biosynthesis